MCASMLRQQPCIMETKSAGPLVHAQAIKHTRAIVVTRNNVVLIVVTTKLYAWIHMEMGGMVDTYLSWDNNIVMTSPEARLQRT